jgi:ParB-like chromosome segregation protein Spo0J
MKILCSHDEALQLHKIIPNPKNPNKHSKDQIARLARLIDYQGQRHPIIISKRSGFVVVGHGRLEAINLLGWDKAAVNYQDFESEAQEYAFVVSDNAIAEWAELDLKSIGDEVLSFEDFENDLLGLKNFDEIDPVEVEKENKEVLDEKKFLLLIELEDENELRMLFDEMNSREIKSTIME